jgi:cellulose biosynthesis protein BcsQ
MICATSDAASFSCYRHTKTTLAVSIAVELARRGHPVHLSTTDPAAHIDHLLEEENELNYIREVQSNGNGRVVIFPWVPDQSAVYRGKNLHCFCGAII